MREFANCELCSLIKSTCYWCIYMNLLFFLLRAKQTSFNLCGLDELQPQLQIPLHQARHVAPLPFVHPSPNLVLAKQRQVFANVQPGPIIPGKKAKDDDEGLFGMYER